MGDKDRVLCVFERSADEQMRVVDTSYKGSRYLNFRIFYRKGQDWLPGTKGVTVRLRELPVLLEALQGIAP
jgi:hypothetical protein